MVNQDDKIKKIEEVNPHLGKDLEEPIAECEENSKMILDLKQTVKNLLDKLDTSERNNLKIDAMKNLKDEEIGSIKTKITTFLLKIKSENKTSTS